MKGSGVSTFDVATNIASFDAVVSGHGLMIAKFQTKTCVICRRLEPALKQLAERTNQSLHIMDVDAEENTELAEHYNVRGVPTLILFKDGHELTRCNGFQSTTMLREWIAPHVDH